MSSIHTKTLDLSTKDIQSNDGVHNGSFLREFRVGEQFAVPARPPEVVLRVRCGTENDVAYISARSDAVDTLSSPFCNGIVDNSSLREDLTGSPAKPAEDVFDNRSNQASKATNGDGGVDAAGDAPTITSSSVALESTPNSQRSRATILWGGSPSLRRLSSTAQSTMLRVSSTLSPSVLSPSTPSAGTTTSPSLVSDSFGACSFGLDAGSVFGSLPMLTSPGYMLAGQQSLCEVMDHLKLPPAKDEPDNMTSCSVNVREPSSEIQLTTDRVANSVGGAGDGAATAERPEAPGPNALTTRRSSYRRMLTLAFVFFFAYAPFFSLRNVQGSLSDDPSLGMLSIGCLYALPWFGAVCSYPIVHLIGPKWSIACATSAFLLFAASTFHYVKYVALPASLLQGFGIGLIWAAEGLYMVNVASEFAAATAKPLSSTIERFNTILYGPYLSSNVVGNGLSSIILQISFPGYAIESGVTALLGGPLSANVTSYNSSTEGYYNYTSSEGDSSIAASCGIAFSFAERAGPNLIMMPQKYTLVSVMTLMASVSLLLSIFGLDKLSNAHLTGARNVFTSLVDMLAVCVDPRLLLLFPMFVYYGFSGSLLFGDFTRAFVTCSSGASTVGLTFVVGAALAVFSSFLGSAAARRVGRMPVMITACIVASAAFVIMLVWTPMPGGGMSALLFLPVSVWCLSDGILSSNTNALQNLIFKERYPSSCAAYLLVYGGSVAMGALTTAFQWMTLLSKTYMVIGMLATALVSYSTLEILLRRGTLSSE